ncbi:MAG TPA: antitoxin Xre/MbcA/ParS toxin-binding domain-containing protein [Mucilaginibacter sp.]|jgi:putative toxin-antitoxin system antitoxin component (TIGR02293 family)|nr:antitoxin Xre/MbcA/ParS toxin-binding domain-containing protein [Mucilaginibacter sp.]
MSHKKEHNQDNYISEPMTVYITQSKGSLFRNLFAGNNKSYQSATDFDILQLTRNGLPKHLLLSLAKKISLTIQELADIMHISERTLQRYDDDAIIKTEYAEKAVELARLYTRGEEVFGSLDKFKTWMKTPLHVFKGETPVSLLDTSVGFDIIFKELGRIEHGIFA